MLTSVAKQEWITKESMRAFNIFIYFMVQTWSMSHLIEGIRSSQLPCFSIYKTNWIVANIFCLLSPFHHPVSLVIPFTCMNFVFSSASSTVSSHFFVHWEPDATWRSSSWESLTSHTIWLSHWFPAYSRMYLCDGRLRSGSESWSQR